jgi:hypothetical protein
VVSWERMSLQSAGRSVSLDFFLRRRGVFGCGVPLGLVSRWEEIWETRSVAVVVWSFDGGDGEGVAFSSFRLWSPIVMLLSVLLQRFGRGLLCYGTIKQYLIIE